MQFEFATAHRIVFGPGTVRQIGELARALGRHCLVVAGANPARAEVVLERLEAAGVSAALFPVAGEPSITTAQQAAEAARAANGEVVIGFGGGSALDTAKAAAALLANPGDPLQYLEVVGQGRPLPNPAAPCIAIPTTAGTGSEVTRNAVLGVPLPGEPTRQVKVSLRSASMLPRVALVDPELTYRLPPEPTAASGLDALTQLVEPFLSNRANPLTDGFCREGIPRVARSLRTAYAASQGRGDDPPAREDMALAGLLGGLALANARLGAVHGFASPLGGMYPAPHGAVCARLLPVVMEANLRALQAQEPENPILSRFTEVAHLLTGKEGATAEEGVAWVAALVRDLNIPPLRTYGLRPEDFFTLAEKASGASSMQGNPVRLTLEELEAILTQAY